MERIVRRAAQAARVAARKSARLDKFIKNGKEKNIKLTRERGEAAERKMIAEERQRRQQAWLRGPLAPRPDVGKHSVSFGTFPPEIYQVPEELEARRPEWFHIQAGDRVLVTKGRGKGTISQVEQINYERCMVYLKDVKINMEVPRHLVSEVGNKKVVAQLLGIHFDDIKLVYPLQDAETGRPVDAIIEKMDAVGREWNRVTRKYDKGYRVIHGTTTIIPWPETFEDDELTYDIDTPEHLVLQQTYQPSLITLPMPASIIDELRNKYSKFRTRHDAAYIEKVEQKAQREVERKELLQTMRTPLQELAALRAKQKAERQQELTEDQLAKIGEIMASAEQVKATVTA